MKKIILFCSLLMVALHPNSIFASNEQQSVNSTKPIPPDTKEDSAINKIDLSGEVEIIGTFIGNGGYYTALGYIQTILKNVRQMDPMTKYDFLLMGGNSYMNLGMYDKAEEYFQNVLSMKKKSGEAYQALQKIALLKNDEKKSIEHYKKAIQYTKAEEIPDTSHYFAMIAYYRMEQFKKCLEVSLTVSPKPASEYFPYIQYMSALAVMKAKNTDKKNVSTAITILKKLGRDLKYPDKFREKANLTLAMILFDEKAYDDSLKQFEPLRVSSYSDDALYGIIWNYIKLKKYDDAFKNIDNFLSLYRESKHYEDLLMLKGQLFKKVKKFKESVTAFEEAKKEFNYTVDFIETYMMKKKYIKRVRSLFEVAEFPAFRYFIAFKYLELKSEKIRRYNEKRVLKSVARKKNIYKHLLRLTRLRNIMDSLGNAQIRHTTFARKYKYNIIHYKNMLRNFSDEIESLKTINIIDIKDRIAADSESQNVRSFTSQGEQFILKQIEVQLDNAIRLSDYIESIMQLLETAAMDKEPFFRKLQEMMLQSPVFSKSSKNVKDRIVQSLSQKKPVENLAKEDIMIIPEEGRFLTAIEKEHDKLLLINQTLNSILFNVASTMYKEEEDSTLYWKEEHEKIKSAILEIKNVAAIIEKRLFSTKADFDKNIQKKIGRKKIFFEQKLKTIEKRATELEITSNLLIMHIDSLMEDMKPMRKMITKTARMIRWLENKNIWVLQQETDSFKNLLLEEIKNRKDEYNALIEEADYEIADSLFYITTGE